MLYFDHAASTPMNERGLAVLAESLRNDFANPSAAHRLGRDLMARIDKARQLFLSLLDASDFDFIFTSSATESNNTVLRGLSLPEGSRIFYSSADHPSLYRPAEEHRGVELVQIPLDIKGQVDYLKLSGMMDDRVSLLVLSQVNNHSGNLQDIDRVGAILKGKSPKAHLHVDGVQAFGKLPFTLKRSHVDSYTISGHKIGAPKGISGLYLRKGVVLSPLLHGGGQEMGLRSSTLAAPLIFSFSATAQDVLTGLEEKLSHVQQCKAHFQEKIAEDIPSAIFPFSSCSPYILTFIVPGLASDILMRQLERHDVFVSSSSACSSKVKGFSPVYQALGIEEKHHKSVLRLSFSATQTEEEFVACAEQLKQAFHGLQHLIKG